MAKSNSVGTFEVEIRSKPVIVEVDTDGRFSAAINEKRFSADKLEDLRASLMAHTKKITAKVTVPATYITTNGSYGTPSIVRAVTLTGIHAKDGDILFRYDDDGKADRATAHSNFLKPMSAAERASYNTLSKAKHEATRQVEEFMSAHKFSAMRAVEIAIEQVSD